MTVCIVARCAEDDSFVSVADRMLSYSFTSADRMALKKLSVATRWQAMYSASDIASVLPIWRQVQQACRQQKSQSFAFVQEAFETAYRAERERIINGQILSKVKLNLEVYQREGYARLGPDVHAAIYREIDAFKVGLDFLVYGFDDDGMPHIFLVEEPGHIRSLDIEGFGVIGSGWALAHASLLSRDLPVYSKLEMVYRVCEAKFVAERAPGVGRDTMVAYMDKSPFGTTAAAFEKYLDLKEIAAMRRAWERHLNRPIPKAAAAALKRAVQKSVTMKEMVDLLEITKRQVAAGKPPNQAS